MTHLLNIKVRFRGLDLHLNLISPRGDPLKRYLFSGPNSSGKTTLLEAIALGLCGDSFVRDSFLRRDEEIEVLVSHQGKTFTCIRGQESWRGFKVDHLFIPQTRRAPHPLTLPYSDLDKLNAFWRHFDAKSTLGISQEEIVIRKEDTLGHKRMGGAAFDLLSMASTILQSPPGILLLIDMPELHLSPEWRTSLLGALSALSPSSPSPRTVVKCGTKLCPSSGCCSSPLGILGREFLRVGCYAS